MALLLAPLACGADDAPAVIAPASQSDGCHAPEVALADGSCIRPGVPQDGCAAGFVHDAAYGCDPLLPADPCPTGKMALPGETACRAVMPCGPGKWGDIPVAASTVYVDASFSGASDGSAAKPFPTVAKGYAAAAGGAIVAIAAGSYAEDVVVNGKPVRLWGVCPDLVEIAGTGAQIMPLQLTQSGANGSEVHGIAFRGPKNGLGVAGATNVLIDRVWIHDTGSIGFVTVGYFGPTSVKLVGSLIEKTKLPGAGATGATLEIEDSVVRGGRLGTELGLPAGAGISLCNKPECPIQTPGALAIRHSVIEGNENLGVVVVGTDLVVESSVVRNNLPNAADQTIGTGIQAEASCPAKDCSKARPATLAVRGSVISGNRHMGVWGRGAAITIEHTTIRDTKPQASDSLAGRGVEVQALISCSGASCVESAPGKLTLLRSVIEKNHNIGVYLYGATATFDGAVMRDTLPRALDQRFGVGLEVLAACSPNGCGFALPSHASLRDTLIERSQWGGIIVSSSELTLERTTIRDTTAGIADGLFGDAISISRDYAPATAELRNVLLANSARAGIGSFGARVAVEASAIRCAGFDLEGENVNGVSFAFDDRGGNRCGCDGAASCKAVSTGLTAPTLEP